MKADLLLSVLHHGRCNAQSAKDLAFVLGCSERTVGQLAAELIDDGVLIGSSCDAERHGYFLIEDLDDLEIGTAHIRSRALASLQRVSKLRHAAAARFGEQETLRLFDLKEVSA